MTCAIDNLLTSFWNIIPVGEVHGLWEGFSRSALGIINTVMLS